MEKRPHKVAGRILEPKRAISRQETKDPAAAVSTTRLYVGSIGTLKEEELQGYFDQFGKCENVEIAREGDGSTKGHAFVYFADHDSVDRAVVGEHTVCGRPVDVRKALTRHQIETAQKKREYQARRGARERDQRHYEDHRTMP